MAAMEITEDTPITMPVIVNAERTLLERSAVIAARKFSRAWEGVMIAITQTSRRRWDLHVTRALQDRSQKTIRSGNSSALPQLPRLSAPRPETECTYAKGGQSGTPAKCRQVLRPCIALRFQP